ncbi:MAG: hypothetical protein ABJI96_04360 [Paracoccaceae bacterium]
MRRFALIALLIWPMNAAADGDWFPLNGEEIRLALSDRKLVYEIAWQEFRSSGRTLYNAGADSWGYWRVTGDQYCSHWPPNDLWTCYAMDRSGETLRFVGKGGDITEAHYAE